MGAKRLDDLRAWQAAHRFKLEVYGLVRRSMAACEDYRFKSQLYEAAASGESNVAEGFHRFVAGEFAHFLGFARASIGEAQVRLQDGVDRGYFTDAEAADCLKLGTEAMALVTALKTSLQPFINTRGKPSTAPAGLRTDHGPRTTRTLDNK